MEITHDVTIDLLRPRQNVIRVVQEDSTRMIRLKLLSNNQNYNVADDLDESETLLKFVEFRKADGHGGMYDTTSTGETAVELEDQSVGNVWLVALDGQCFTCPGWTQINVRFETEDGKRIHTFRIMVDVEPTASSDTESTDWGELNSIADLRNAVSAMFEETMSVEAKQALLNLLAHVAYTDEHGQDYYDELETELFRTAGIVSISAVFDQGSAVIYDTDDLDTLRQYLTVTATYEDLSEREIDTYTLSGTLTAGTSTITVSYGGKTTTFDVVVTESLLPAGYTGVSCIVATQTGLSAGSAAPKQYINLGFAYNAAKSYRLETEIKWNATQPVESFPNSYAQMFAGGAIVIGIKTGKYFYSTSNYLTSLARSTTDFDAVAISTDVATMVCSLSVNGERVEYTRTAAFAERNTYLFGAAGSAGTPVGACACSMKRTKIYVDDVLYMDLVPCLRNSDSVAGMYDRIGETFLHSAGANEFDYEA